MNRTERLSSILSFLSERGQLTIEEISERIGVSSATIRRDLDSLAEQQLLARTRGGAAAHSVAYDLPIRYKNQQHLEEKRAIAKAASALVPRGAVVGLCGGTTTTAIVDALMTRADIMKPANDPGLTIVTNALNMAMQLAMRPQIKTVVIGGVVHQRSYELIGSYASAVLESITLDIAFVGVNGIDAVVGPTAHDEREAAVSALMASRATTSMLVADSSKIDKRAFAAIGSAKLFNGIITDSAITAEQQQRLVDAGFEVIIAD